MQIGILPLRRLVAAIFSAAGCDAAESDRIALYLSNANLAGHDSHGVIRVPRYVEYLRAGKVKAGQELTVLTENDVLAVLDGNFGFGQTVGPLAVRYGIDKAARNGVALIALRNAGHLGRIGEWAEMAVGEGLVSVHFVNVAGSLLVAPFGGVGRRMSTAPFAAGVPIAGRPPMILDFATSVVAEGKALVAMNGGKPLPDGSLIGADGKPTADPVALYGAVEPGTSPNPRNGPGAIRAMGEHKGSGLALLCELLAGALTGSGCAGPAERSVANGMLSLYMSPEFFVSGNDFAGEVATYIDFFKSAQPADPDGEVLIPGEPERQRRAERERDGVPLTDDAWQALLGAAHGVGLSEADTDALLA